MSDREIQFMLPDNLKSIGILGHLITANQLVHSDQIKCLEQYLSMCHISIEDTCLSAIIDGKDDALPFALAVEAFSTENLQIQECLYYLLVELAYADGSLDCTEKALLRQVQCNSKITPERCADLAQYAQQNAMSIHSDSNSLFTRPYLEPVTLKSLILRFINWLCMLLRKLFHLPIAKQATEEDYVSVIRKCAEIAESDFSAIQPAYERLISQCKDTIKELAKMKEPFNLDTDISVEVAQVISSFSDCLSENVLNQSQKAHLGLIQKERTLSDFTITLLGRTKAGKSTLHSILTGQGRDRIGVGMQRTTRYNYVYQWNLLRLIDTPGIGSAEDQGRGDDLITASVLEESDIICLIIVDDSILQDVLEFMKRLSTLNKPIIILLNHKENIEASVKFHRFIADPTSWLTNTGEENLQGYINRIRRYAQQEGFDSLLSVYPVFLLPALMAQEEKYTQYSKILWDSSNIDTFIEQLKVWITVFGPLKRSQTLIDGTIQNFSFAEQIISQGLSPVQSKVDRLKQSKITAMSHIRKQQSVLLKDVEQYLKDQYHLLETKYTLEFAEEHWNDNGDLAPKWSEYLEQIRFKEDIETQVNSLVSDFFSKIDDAVREIFEDFYFSFQSYLVKPSFKNSLSFDFRSFTRILGGFFDVLGSVAIIFLPTNPIGWGLTVAGLAMGLISRLFKSKEKRRKEKVDKIYEVLSSSIQQKTPQYIDDTISQIHADTDRVITRMETLFDYLTQGLERTIEIGNGLTTAYTQQTQSLNTIFAWRILTFLMGITESYQKDKVDKLVREVERTDARIRIVTPAKVKYTPDTLKNVIAEEIEIITMES